MTKVVLTTNGIRFEAADDRGRIIVSGQDTDGRYSLLEWRVAAGSKLGAAGKRDYGVHLHRKCEETFLIQSGALEFLIGDQVVELSEGDFVRVPAGVHHGYQNVSGQPVDMLVGFIPAGIEELFVKYRTDQPEIIGPGFKAEATQDHASEFDIPYP